jgi:hypothetical protein
MCFRNLSHLKQPGKLLTVGLLQILWVVVVRQWRQHCWLSLCTSPEIWRHCLELFYEPNQDTHHKCSMLTQLKFYRGFLAQISDKSACAAVAQRIIYQVTIRVTHFNQCQTLFLSSAKNMRTSPVYESPQMVAYKSSCKNHSRTQHINT